MTCEDLRTLLFDVKNDLDFIEYYINSLEADNLSYSTDTIENVIAALLEKVKAFYSLTDMDQSCFPEINSYPMF